MLALSTWYSIKNKIKLHSTLTEHLLPFVSYFNKSIAFFLMAKNNH